MLFSVLWISKSSGLSRLGDGERLSARELLEDDDLRRRPLDDRRLPLLRRLSTDESDLDRLVERDGFRVFLTGLLDIDRLALLSRLPDKLGLSAGTGETDRPDLDALLSAMFSNLAWILVMSPDDDFVPFCSEGERFR